MNEPQKTGVDNDRRSATPSAVRGHCRLCRNEDFLCNSHLIPAGFFRLLRSTTVTPRDPLVVSSKVTFTSSRQTSDYLLCTRCEDRFRLGGEEWVLRNCYRVGDSFKIRDMVLQCKLLHRDQLATIFSGSTNGDIEICRLAYFALSIFWRAAVHAWQVPIMGSQRLISLGPYEEELRGFLLNTSGFPPHAVLLAWVSRLQQPSRAVTYPYSQRVFDCHCHSFDVPGIRFDLLVAKALPDDIRLMCLATGKDHPILLSDAPDDILASHFSRLGETSRLSDRLRKLGKWSWTD